MILDAGDQKKMLSREASFRYQGVRSREARSIRRYNFFNSKSVISIRSFLVSDCIISVNCVKIALIL